MVEVAEQRLADLEALLAQALEAVAHHGPEHRNLGLDPIPGYHQVKSTSGAPTHVASESTRCWVSPDSEGYINNDGSTGWTLQETGGAGAPKGAQYVTLALNADLTAERRLVAGTGLTAVDGGANGDVTLNVDNDHAQAHTLTSHSSKPHSELSDAPTDAHHTKYTDSDAISAVEGEATLDLTGILGLAKEAQLDAISTPMNPASSKVKMFARLNGGNIEIIGRGPTGAECVICTVSNVVHTNKLALNWIE